MAAKVGAIKAGGLDLGELYTLFKIATGQQSVTFNSIGVELKGWECIKFEVCADPILNTAPVAEDDTQGVDEDGTISGSVFATDADGDVLTYKANGTVPAGLTFNTDGSYTFDATHPAYQSPGGRGSVPLTCYLHR